MPRFGAYVIGQLTGFDDEAREVPLGWTHDPCQAVRIAQFLDQRWVKPTADLPPPPPGPPPTDEQLEAAIKAVLASDGPGIQQSEDDLIWVHATSAGYPGSEAPEFDPIAWDETIRHLDQSTDDSLDARMRRRFRELYSSLPLPYTSVSERSPGKLGHPEGTTGGGESIGGPKTIWKTISYRLWEKMERGEPYTNLRDLAEELGCKSDATIRKVIRKSEKLREWQDQGSGRTTAPKATGLDGLDAIGGDKLHQTKEPAPDDYLPDDDMEIMLAKLRDQAKPEDRAKLDALNDAERRELVAAYQAQKLDDEPSPLDLDTPGQRPREVRSHKRA